MSTVEQDPYATAAGLVARSAAAYAASVPEDPADEGFFGPGSVAWRVSTDLSSPVAGLRALLLQALHPLAMAGVDQHSDWRRDPVGLAGRHVRPTWPRSTSPSGRWRERAAARVRRDHERVTGVDPVTGRATRRVTRRCCCWVHGTLVESGIVAAALFGTPLSPADSDRYVAEMVVAAQLVGVPPARSRPAWPELHGLPQLGAARSCAARRWPGSRWPTCSTHPASTRTSPRSGRTSATPLSPSLPSWARGMYGYPEPEPLTASRRAEFQQALGVLDAVFLGEPGVLGGTAADRTAGACGAAPVRRLVSALTIGDRSRLCCCSAAGCSIRGVDPLLPRRLAAARRDGDRGFRGVAPPTNPAAGGARAGRDPARRARRRCATPAAHPGCSPPRASTASSCAPTWPCRPLRTWRARSAR